MQKQKDHIFLLGKVFSKKEYAEDFLKKGRLLCNTLQYFKEYKDKFDNNIGDVFEGIATRIMPDSDAKIFVNGISIDYEDIHIHSKAKLSSNVFCMYAPNTLEHGGITEDFVKNLIKMEKSVGNLGSFLVIIIDVPKFLDRVRESLKLLGHQSRMHCVGYMDLNKSFNIPDEQIGFIKDLSYSNQKEFRILIERDNPNYEPLFFEIGGLEDIGGLIPLSKFNDNFEIRLIEKN